MAVFAQLTDLHLRPPGVPTLGTIDADTLAARAVDALVARHGDADAVLVTGDIADLGEEEAYSRAAMLLSRLSVPVLVVPGNHDRTGALREAFIAWPGVADAPVPDRLCHARTLGDATVVMLDTSVDGIERGENHGTLGAAQLEWLDATLAAAGPTLIAMHHPPFPVAIGFMDAIGLTDADDFAAVIARHGNVQRIVCGHVHRVIVGTVGGVPAMAIPAAAHQVRLALSRHAAPELVMEPPAYGVHIVGSAGAVSHIGYVEEFAMPRPFDDKAGERVT